ncbi:MULTISPECIES: AIR synthase-related protein [Parabacteroides]|uniref:AIR synthase-related protein n=1 Tax=Parabacteroides TaxID=375288 RepID=UPI001E6010D1|nr:AIR synthase-related protein [Parabacteroides sp.]MCI7459472.1 AIR synthase-related protein [Parabacteroides merdae]MDB8969516.1 AIR synthase-related protein [Parabacteroides merdae]MDB8976170.1 AIR synthase-related protein [Parabacteroides merdae]MDB8981588.1 AIR synthase-related protein [Parabacteroides merdae]MDB8983747.1 AIR synthase-related protein [Parabacteroides merdae]
MLPILDAVRGASEILGLDPLYIANKGLVLVILPEEKTEQALAVMQNYPEGKNATVIGCIQEKGYALVKMKTLYGNYRIVDMLSDEQLPRI